MAAPTASGRSTKPHTTELPTDLCQPPGRAPGLRELLLKELMLRELLSRELVLRELMSRELMLRELM